MYTTNHTLNMQSYRGGFATLKISYFCNSIRCNHVKLHPTDAVKCHVSSLFFVHTHMARMPKYTRYSSNNACLPSRRKWVRSKQRCEMLPEVQTVENNPEPTNCEWVRTTAVGRQATRTSNKDRWQPDNHPPIRTFSSRGLRGAGLAAFSDLTGENDN